MLIPRFWAEARVQHREKRRQVTVRRFGWSQASEAEAQANATARAQESLQHILAGEKLLRREPKQAYNGAEGVPIREEIVAEHGNVVITRNSYGALCLNTPDVLFADVDFEPRENVQLGCVLSLLMLISSACVAWKLGSAGAFLGLAVASVLLGFSFAMAFRKLRLMAGGGAEKIALSRIEAFVRKHTSWHLRLYRTPAGFRVLVTHQVFAANAPEVATFFAALRTDPVYVAMCQRQQCFRARVSPKPWRIGIKTHIKPHRGVWPVRAEALPARKAWIDGYHSKAASFASCRFERELGSGGIADGVRQVLNLHDELCRANSGLPIA